MEIALGWNIDASNENYVVDIVFRTPRKSRPNGISALLRKYDGVEVGKLLMSGSAERIELSEGERIAI